MVQSRDLPFIINLGNSIIGVSVLAIPFCFHQCGIVLGSLLLFLSSLLTRLSCDILLRAANSTKKRTYEYLAHHTFGSVGKSLVEISIIGLLFGTCIAFHVIVGDLSPSIVSVLFGVENTPTLRAIVMVSLAICVSLPLSLMRNIQSLSGISAVSLGFYLIFILQIFLSSLPNLVTGALTQVRLWKLSGTFHCLPIFLMAFTCQTQLFLVYDALPEPSVNVMSSIVSSAVNMVSVVYFLVGFFGYTAFCFDGVKGDVLMNFGNGIVSALLKLGFVLSIVVSFPLAIFPCRASINSLLAKQSSSHDAIASPGFIPHNRFVIITVCIMTSTLIIGILIPQVEVILALTGAIMGTLICYIVPGAMFLHLTPAGTKQRQIAKIVLVIGLFCLVTSSFTIIGQLDVKKAQPQMQAVDIKDRQDNLLPGKDSNLFNKPAQKDSQKDGILNHQKDKIDNANNIKDSNGNEPLDKDRIKQNVPKVTDSSRKKSELVNNPDEQNHLNHGKVWKVKDAVKKDTVEKEIADSSDKKNSKSTKDELSRKTDKVKEKNNIKKSKNDLRLEPIAPEDSANENAKKMIKSLEKKVQDLKDLKKSAEKNIEKSKNLIANQNNSGNGKKDIRDDSDIQKGKDQIGNPDLNLKTNNKHDKIDKVENAKAQNGEKSVSNSDIKNSENGLKNVDSSGLDQSKKRDNKSKESESAEDNSNRQKSVKHGNDNDKEKINQVSNSNKLDISDSNTKTGNEDRNSNPQKSKPTSDVSKSKNDKMSEAVDSVDHKSHKSTSKDSANGNSKPDETDLSADGSKSKSEENHLEQKEKALKRKEAELKGMQLKLKEMELKLKEDKIQGKIEELQQKTKDLNKEIVKKTEDKNVPRKNPTAEAHIQS